MKPIFIGVAIGFGIYTWWALNRISIKMESIPTYTTTEVERLLRDMKQCP